MLASARRCRVGRATSPETQKNLEKIHKEAVRCQKIVQNLLTFARKRAPERRKVDVNALVEASAGDTCLTEAFSVMWPNAPHRVLRSAIAAAEALGDEIIGEARYAGEVLAVHRLSVIAPSVTTTGRVDAMALYAGESVANVSSVQPAAAIVAELVAGAERLLRAPALTPG